MPLYLQILAWFFLNLIVLALVAVVFVQAQFQVGFESLLLGRMGDRVETLTELAGAQLAETPRDRWDEVLERFGEAYGVGCHLLAADGKAVAGTRPELPSEVQARLGSFGPGHAAGMRQGAAGAAPGFGEGRRGLGPPAGRGPGARALQPFRGPHPKFMMRTRNPTRYWVGVRMPSPDPPGPRGEPLVLLLVSDSLLAGGLFLDWRPWAVLGGGALLFSVLFWLPLVHRITRTVSQMTRVTGRIAEGDFEARVGTQRRDELGDLADAINRMAARLDGFVQGQRRFLGDVAHELCSPLARIQVALGVLEQRADDRQRAHLDDLREEIQEMSALVNELLSFSRAALQGKAPVLKPVNLAEIARRAVDREASGFAVSLQIEDPLTVLADPDLLQRAVANLLRNAIRYARSAGPIEVTAVVIGERVRLSVADHGPGVPEAELGRIFDPFYRVEASRSREGGGAGLGLAIVKTCVEACAGTVTARNRAPTGLIVEIDLAADGKVP